MCAVMENDNTQKELFEFETPKSTARRKFARFLEKNSFGIALTGEKIVILSIGIVMLMVIFFALGVERGKHLAVKSDAAAQAPVQAPVTQVPAQAPARVPVQVPAKVTVKNIAQNKTAVTPVNTAPAQIAAADNKPYVIVAAAFSRQDFALKEVSALKTSGLDAFMLKSDPYYLACAGSFATKELASKALGKVRQIHKDAYIRLK